ncbi:MAG: type II secretion system protein GspN, partial [Gammaproteobacteria bacterium]|nr:type II secretion system protein GspN [Gammaproteobacteria bacterium]
MIRTLIVGIALFLIFAVMFAPASLIRRVLPTSADVELLTPTGTLWNGAAELYLGGQSAGRLHWDFDAVTILQGMAGYDVQLTGPEHTLSGTVAAGIDAATARLDGQAQAAFVNRWLAPYDIAIDGALSMTGVDLRLPYDAPVAGAAGGSVRWAGGPVRYRLGGRSHAGDLPPLVAYLGEG